MRVTYGGAGATSVGNYENTITSKTVAETTGTSAGGETTHYNINTSNSKAKLTETTASKTLNSNSAQAIQIKKSTLYSPLAAVFSPTIKSNTLNNIKTTTANNIGIINWLEKYWYIIVGAAISIILIAYIMRW